MSIPNPKKPATLRSIAERAGVSVCTVSLSMRNHPSIPEKTRRRIQKIAKTLDYRPNAMVSVLMARIHSHRSDSEPPVLGLIYGGERSGHFDRVPFYKELLRGVRERARQLGYRAEDFVLKSGAASARALCRTLHARNIRGVVVMPLSGGTECRLSFSGLASCALGYTIQKPDLHRVVPNYEHGMRLAWGKLLERGYGRPGLVATESHLRGTHYGRYAAFMAQQAMYPDVDAVPPLVFPILPDTENLDSCMRMFEAWFRRHRPDVLLFPPWIILKRLGEMVKIPEEVGVVMADVEAGWCRVHEDAFTIGGGAIDTVVAQIHRNETGVPEKSKILTISNDWVEGFSLPVRKQTRRRGMVSDVVSSR